MIFCGDIERVSVLKMLFCHLLKSVNCALSYKLLLTKLNVYDYSKNALKLFGKLEKLISLLVRGRN